MTRLLSVYSSLNTPLEDETSLQKYETNMHFGLRLLSGVFTKFNQKFPQIFDENHRLSNKTQARIYIEFRMGDSCFVDYA